MRDFLNRYPFVYVKPDGGGQGKGISRIGVKTDGLYSVHGYSTEGKPFSLEAHNLNQIKKIIQPTSFDEKHKIFILQQGITSISKDGVPSGIRVHTQKVKNKWVRSGILGKVVSSEDGIVNWERRAEAIPIEEFLTHHAGMDKKKVKEIKHISLKVSQAFSKGYNTYLFLYIELMAARFQSDSLQDIIYAAQPQKSILSSL